MASSDVLERFKRLIAAKRLAHAYLFAGPADTGKMETALAVAQLVNCEDIAHAPCGTCGQCRKIAAGIHPDMHIITVLEDENSILIEQIRHMLGRAALRAFEARTKVFILRDAHRMTTEASNALLKTLEEPAPNTLMILTTCVPEACLGTVKSRCHTVKFFRTTEPLPKERERVLDVFLSRVPHEDYLKSLSTDKAQVSAAMLTLLGFLRDAMLYKNGVQAQDLAYKNRLNDLKKMSERNMEDLCAVNAQIVRVKSLAGENLNVKMALSLVRERLWGN